MLIRLNGGPMHNKVMHVPNRHRSQIFRYIPRNRSLINYMQDDTSPLAVDYAKSARYDMLGVQNPLNDDPHTIPCVTPKGEVIFRYVKEKS